jgi:hypothetical protein
LRRLRRFLFDIVSFSNIDVTGEFCTGEMLEKPGMKELEMARKEHGAEQIVALLRQIEVELANHKNIGQACKEVIRVTAYERC